VKAYLLTFPLAIFAMILVIYAGVQVTNESTRASGLAALTLGAGTWGAWVAITSIFLAQQLNGNNGSKKEIKETDKEAPPV
jgi:uncharacterized protein (UPF0333 family)